MAKARRQAPDIARLGAAMARSRLALRRFRENRKAAVKQFAGRNWSEDGSDKAVPLNLLAMYVRIVGGKLVSQNPRVMLSTFNRAAKPVVSAMETWVNRRIGQMHFAETLSRWVTDALFSVGILKIALASPADAANVGWNLRAGSPYAATVDLDDFVFDVHARTFNECSFIGHRYRVPLEAVRDSKLYGPGRKRLSADTDSPYNAEGDERVTALGRSPFAQSDPDEFEEMVSLWEIYLPRTRRVITLPDEVLGGSDMATDEPLRDMEWVGPDDGPFHVLGLGLVPGNAMPKAPIMDLVDLHEAVNRQFRKLISQSDRQKEVLLVAGSAMEDGSRIVQANDGEAIRADQPDKAKVAQFGGPNQTIFAAMTSFIDRFSWQAGNLDSLGGLSPQAKTATQDQMLAANSSAAVADMQSLTVGGTIRAIAALCWFWHHDPFGVMRTTHTLPGLPDVSIDRSVTPQQRMQIPFDDLDIRIDPYSLQHTTPQARLQALTQLVQGIILPAMPVLQQQGIGFDIGAYLEKVARYSDQPDLPEIVTLHDPVQPAGGDDTGAEQPGMPSATTRTYERINRPGGTREGKDQTLVASLMGGNPQASEMQGLRNPTG